MVKIPKVLWWQDWEHVYVCILANIKSNPEHSETLTRWSCEESNYCLSLDWFLPVGKVINSQITGQGYLRFDVKKIESMWWSRLTVTKDSRIFVDWKHWVDKDDLPRPHNLNSKSTINSTENINIMKPPSEKTFLESFPDTLRQNLKTEIEKVFQLKLDK